MIVSKVMKSTLRIQLLIATSNFKHKWEIHTTLGSDSHFWTPSSTTNTCELILTSFQPFFFFFCTTFLFSFFFHVFFKHKKYYFTNSQRQILPPHLFFLQIVDQKEFPTSHAPLFSKNNGMDIPMLG